MFRRRVRLSYATWRGIHVVLGFAALTSRPGRRGTAWTIALGVFVAGASMLPLLAGTSARWLISTMACLPILIVGALGPVLHRSAPTSSGGTPTREDGVGIERGLHSRR